MEDILHRFPALELQLERWHDDLASAPAMPRPAGDDALVQACTELLIEEHCGPHFEAIDPADWENYQSETQRLHEQVQQIATMPARTAPGLRAKARVLQSLLSQGADLYDDASSPDRIAWSLVQDVLAVQEIIE